MPTIEDRGIIYDASLQPKPGSIACFTSLFRASSGDLFCSFHAGSAKHALDSNVRICRSRDGGKTWMALPFRFESAFGGVPGSIAAGELVETEPGKLLLIAAWFNRSDPKKPLFDPVTEGILPTKQLAATSSDSGETWTPWKEVPTEGLNGCSTTGPILKWKDGTIAYAFESYNLWDDPGPKVHAAWLTLSRDGGKTFSGSHLVARHPKDEMYYWDQRLCKGARDGEYIGMFWVHDLKEKRDRRVHFLRSSLADAGEAAKRPVETNIPGQITSPLLLEDGRILAFVVDRSRPATMKLWVSGDGGKSWPEKDAIVVYNHEEQGAITQGKTNIDFKQYWEDMGKWSFGHPAICSLGNGRVLLAHYAGNPDCMSIHWVRVRV